MTYLLDANIFIDAKNRYYGFDICPAFWEWLTKLNKSEIVFSIEKVGDELKIIDDQLSTWAAKHGSNFFLSPDSSIQPAMDRVSNWAINRYDMPPVNIFLRSADYYLVAHALAHGHTVVTNEVPANTPRKIKIPNACIGLNIKCMTPFEMLRSERARFILETT